MNRTMKIIAGTCCTIAIGGGAVAAAGPSDSPAVLDPTDAMVAELEMSERAFAEGLSFGAPKLAPEHAERWRAAWNDMAECAHASGVAAFPVAPATFGDGRTPPPVINAAVMGITDEEAAQLMQRCPFDTRLLDRAAFERAARDVVDRTGASLEGPAAP